MGSSSNIAYFLWVGSDIPDLARISVLSAAEAGFDTVLFTDRPQVISHARLRLEHWREIALPWTPDEVRIRGHDKPAYAAFSDLFRFALLSKNDGWWFDTDTIILRHARVFEALLRPGKLTIGLESVGVLNGAVLGAQNTDAASKLYREASASFPVLDRWGVVGPALITRMVAAGEIDAHVLDREAFYGVHHDEVARIYLPDECRALRNEESNWYCLSLWGEVLSRSGLKHLAPPPGSYLAGIEERFAMLGSIPGDDAAMASYLAENLKRLADMDSGRRALRTLVKKVAARFSRRGL